MRLLGRSVTSADPVRDSLLVLSVLAVIVAVLLGAAWASATQDTELIHALERDAVHEAGTAGLETLHTVDHRTVDEDLDAWLAVTAGELHEDLEGDRPSQADSVVQNETVATAQALQAAVTEFDLYDGTARMIAVLDVEIAGESDRHRMNASLAETDQGWRITRVEAVS